MLAITVALLPAKTVEQSELYAWNSQNIEEKQVALGRWIADHTEAGEWFALHDAGALRYVSGRPALDLVGLNDVGALERGWSERLSEVRPRYVVIFPGASPPIADSPYSAAVHRETSPFYTICECPHHGEMVVYEMDWEAADRGAGG